MTSRFRDALLTLATAAALTGIAVATGRPLAMLARPVPIGLGPVGTIGTELLLTRAPEQSRALWNRPEVQAGAVAVVIGIGTAVAWVPLGDTVLPVLLGGLGTYLLLLSGVVAGVVPPPTMWRRV